MADIFISYSSKDRERIKPLADRLIAEGFSVWWDDHLDAGETYDARIQAELDAARWVIVVWSAHAVASDYVRAEAARAREMKKLVPVRIDKVDAPVPFNLAQTIDLSGPEQDRRNWGKVRKRLDGTAKVVAPTAPRAPRIPVERQRNPERMARLPFLAAMAVVIGASYCLSPLSTSGDFLRFTLGNLAGMTAFILAGFAITTVLCFGLLAYVLRLHDLGLSGHWLWILLGLSLFAGAVQSSFGTDEAAKSFAGYALGFLSIGVPALLALVPGQNFANSFGPPPETRSVGYVVGVGLVSALVAVNVGGWLRDYTRRPPSEAMLKRDYGWERFQFADGPVWINGAEGLAPVKGVRERQAASITIWADGPAYAAGRGVTAHANFPTSWDFGPSTRLTGARLWSWLATHGLPSSHAELVGQREVRVTEADPQYGHVVRAEIGRFGIDWLTQVPVPGSDSDNLDVHVGYPVFLGGASGKFECVLDHTEFSFVSSDDIFSQKGWSSQRSFTAPVRTRTTETFSVRNREWAFTDAATGLPVDADGDGQLWRQVHGGGDDYLCFRWIRAVGGIARGFNYTCVDSLDLRSMERRRIVWPTELRSADYIHPNSRQPIIIEPGGYAFPRDLIPGRATLSVGSCRKRE